MEQDPFLKDLWKRKAEAEQGSESTEEKGWALYQEMQKKAEENPELQSLIGEMKDNILRYADSVARFSHISKSKDDIEMLHNADKHRKRMHDGLIATINQLSRLYQKLGLDILWRTDIIGVERERLGEWALSVARHIRDQKFE